MKNIKIYLEQIQKPMNPNESLSMCVQRKMTTYQNATPAMKNYYVLGCKIAAENLKINTLKFKCNNDPNCLRNIQPQIAQSQIIIKQLTVHMRQAEMQNKMQPNIVPPQNQQMVRQ